jgi:hypothetical protein
LTPGFLLAHVVPVEKFADVNYVLHLMLMGVTGYFLLHDITRKRFPALAGGLFLALQPHVVSHILPGHTGHFPMVGYIPGAVLFLRRAIRSRSICYWGLTGLFFGLSVSAGTHDVCFFFALFLAAYGVFLLFQQRRSAGSRPILRTSAGMALALIITLAIGYQAIFHNLILQVKRSAPSSNKAVRERTLEENWFWATQWSVPAEESIDFAVPGFFGWGSSDRENPYRGRIGQTEGYTTHKRGMRALNDVNNYLGAVMVLGILLAVVHRRKDGEMWFFLGAAILSCLLAFGKYAPFYRLFYNIPYAATFRNPIKWFYVTSLCAGVLGAMGIAATEDTRANLMKTIKSSALLFGVAWLVMLIVGGLCLASRPQTSDVFWSNRQLVSLTTRALGLGAVLWLIAGGLLTALRCISNPDAKQGALHIGLKAALVLLLFGELAYVNGHYLPYRKKADLVQGGVLADFLNGQEKPFRIKMLGRHPLFGYINGILVGYHDWEVVDPPSTRNTDDLHMFSAATLPKDLRPESLLLLKKHLQLTNVRFVLLPGLLKADFLKPALQLKTGQRSPPLVVHEFTAALPRHYLVHQWRTVEGNEDRYTSLSGDFDPSTEVLINAPALQVPPMASQPGTTTTCAVKSYDWFKAELEVETDQPAMLVVLDRFDPSWRAFIDDRSGQILRANGMLRAIPVPAGKHTIRMEMAGTGLLPVAIVVSGWLIGLVCAVLVAVPRKRQPVVGAS